MLTKEDINRKVESNTLKGVWELKEIFNATQLSSGETKQFIVLIRDKLNPFIAAIESFLGEGSSKYDLIELSYDSFKKEFYFSEGNAPKEEIDRLNRLYNEGKVNE